MNEEHPADDKDFDFKYVSVEDFKMILKQVKRERQKKKDDAKWDRFVRMKEEEAEQKKRLVDLADSVGAMKLSGAVTTAASSVAVRAGAPLVEGGLRSVGVHPRRRPILPTTPPPPPEPTREVVEHWQEIEGYRDTLAAQTGAVKAARFEGGVHWKKREEPREFIRPPPVQVLSPRSAMEQGSGECWWDGDEPDEMSPSCVPESSVGHGEESTPHSTDIPLQFVQQKPRSYVRQVLENEKESPRVEDPQSVSILTEDLSRIEDQCIKIKVCLEGVMSLLAEPPQPDSNDDEERIKKRSLEFASRFTRNYLCEIRRQMGDVKKQLNGHGSESGWSGGAKPQPVPQFHKFTQAFQTSLQAFMLIEKSSPSIFLASIPPPVLEFLTAFNELCYLTNITYCDGTSAKLLEMEEMSVGLENLLKDFKARPLDSAKAKKKPKKDAKKSAATGKKKKDKYFMYKSNNSFEKLWKKKTQTMVKARQDQLSHRSKSEAPTPPVQEAPRIAEPKMVARQRPSRRQGTRVPENEVKTMMEIVPPQEGSDSEGEIEKTAKIEDEQTKDTKDLEKQVVSQSAPVVDDAVKTMISTIMVEVLNNMNILTAKHNAMGPFDYSRNLISSSYINGISSYRTNEIGSDLTSYQNLINGYPKAPAPPTNVSLICIKESTEEKKEVLLDDFIDQPMAIPVVELMPLPTPKVDTVEVIEIDPKTRYSVLDYRHFFNNYKSSCPLYCGQEEPWDIITRLTEKIINSEITLQINVIMEEKLNSLE